MIKNFLLIILLTLVWIALIVQLNYANFLFGFVIGFKILWLLVRRTDKEEDKGYFYKAPRVLSFAVFFLYEMIKANIEVTYEIMLPKFKMKQIGRASCRERVEETVLGRALKGKETEQRRETKKR